MTKAALDNTGELADGTNKRVTVKATDPAGIPLTDSDNSATVDVTITITEVNEPPAVTGMDAVTFDEVDRDDGRRGFGAAHVH